MSSLLTIQDVKDQARRRVPKMFFQHVDSGSWTGRTYQSNEEELTKIKFRSRVLVDISDRKLESTMIGEKVAMPVALAPTGLAGMQHADGEILAAQAAEQFGVPFTLSTVSICSIEDVAAATTKPFWFQLYVMRDRKFVYDLIDRAKAARCSALVLTLDLQIQGQRTTDIRNGLTTPPRFSLDHLLQIAARPRWAMRMLRTRRHTFGNIVGHAEGVTGIGSMTNWVAKQFDQKLSWKDVDWIRERWGGKLILKGVMTREDALHAADSGCDAVIVSNHGGRQLDGAPASISMLPDIIDAIGHRTEVHFDGGIRSGQDVLRALCLGARGVYIGRPFLWGLGAAGREGVTHTLEILRGQLDTTLALCGGRDIHEASPDMLHLQSNTDIPPR